MPDGGRLAGRLAGRVVLITGAEGAIGRATARRAAAEGARIAAIGLDADGLASLAADVDVASSGAADPAVSGVAWRVADVAAPEAVTAAVDALVAECGRLDVAHANAGVLLPATPVDDLDLTDWDRVLAVDLTGVLLTFRAALRHLGAGGVLLATGSSLAVRPAPGLLPYVAAKAGVHAMARALALELAPRGIRVNVIAPGLADTPMTRAVPGHIERGLAAVPLGTLVTPDEVAAMAVHLMTDEARSITGSVVTIDGGRTAG